MKRTLLIEILLITALALCVSCYRDEIDVKSVLAEPSVLDNGRDVLGVWLLAEGEATAKRLELRSPDSAFLWSLDVYTKEMNGQKYTGSANAFMPLGVSLPEGRWSYTLIFEDGRTSEGKFDIYR